MSTHVDIPSTVVETLLESLGELQRRLDPANGNDYCVSCNVPDITLNGDFSQKLENAHAAFVAGRFLDAAEVAKELLDGLFALIENSAGPGEEAEIIETYFQRLFFPVLLVVLKRFNPTFYMAAICLLYLEARGQEWLSDTNFPDRLSFLFGKILARAIGHVTRNGSDGSHPEPEFEWPVLATDLLGMIALLYHMGGKHRPYFDYWFGYGFDPADPANPTASEFLASRSLSVWWESHPEAKVAQANYTPAPPASAAPARLGATFLPLLEDHGGPFVLALPHLGLADKIRVGDWEFEVTRAETNLFGGNLEVKFSRVGGGDWFSLGNASKEGPNAFLAVKGVEITAKVKYDLNDLSRCDASAAIRFRKVKFSLGNPGGSKLLERALPEGLNGEFDLGIVADARSESIYFEGGIGMDVYMPLNWNVFKIGSIGLDIPTVRLRLKAEQKQSGTTLAAAASLGLHLRLGPLKLLTDGLGVSWSMARTRGTDGNMGPFATEWDLLEPDSFGLTIQTPSVKGEGFISRDRALNRWIGAFSLEFKKIKLAGVVMTEQGSVMAAVWATKLGWPLPIGAIDGLGIVVATDRRGDRQAFLDGLKSGVLDSVLFPADPVLNAPTILATMSSLMPRAEGFTVVGPMVQWVYPDRVSRLLVVELAILLEFERGDLRRIYLLGQGKVRLSRLPERLFSLNIEMFGVIDFEKGEFFIKLSLRNSKIAGGDLTGDGLIYFSKDCKVLSLGGFNPRFQVPAALPPLARVTANIVDTENVKLIFTAYVALTTCSFQIGGSVYVWAGAYGFSIEGFLKADLLARFDGEFFLDVQFGVSLKRGNRILASIHFEGTFSGVSTWRLAGKAKFSILFLSVTIPISFELGGSAPATFDTVDAALSLKQALEAQESWSAGQLQPSVTLRDVPRTGVWIAADQTLRVSQTAVPLGQRITRLGAAPVAVPGEFLIELVTLGGQTRTWRSVEDDFAPGLYQDVDLEEAIRAPQFERMQSGLEIEGQELKLGAALDSGTEFEEQVLDEAPAALVLPAAAQTAIKALDSAAAAENVYYRVAAQPVEVQARRYLVAYTTLEPPPDLDTATVQKGLNYTQAREYKRARTAGLQVVRRYEVNPS